MKAPPLTSLRSRLLVLVLLAIAPAFGLLLYSAWGQRLAAAEIAKQEVLKFARDAVQKQERIVFETRRYLERLAQRAEVDTGKPKECSDLLTDELKKRPQYSVIGTTDLEGNVVCSSLSSKRSWNLSDRIYFQRTIKTGDFAVGDYQISRATGKANISFGYPQFDGAGKLQGIVFVAMDLGWLNDFLATTNRSSDIVLTVIDQGGMILARSHEPENWVGKPISQHRKLNSIFIRGEEVTLEDVGVDGIHRLYAFSPLLISGNPAAYVSVGISTSAAYANVDKTLFRQFLLIGLISALIVLIAWFGSDLFVLRQLNVLIATIKRIAQGDFNARVGVVGGLNEMNQLALAFDQMAAMLETRDLERTLADEARRQRTNELESLYELGQTIINSADLKTVLEDVLAKVLLITDCDIGLIRLVDPKTNMLMPVISRGYKNTETIRPLSLHSDEPNAGRLQSKVCERKGAYVVDNIPGTNGLRTWKKEGVQTALALPIKSGTEVLGTVQLGSRAGRKFTREQLHLLEAIGDQLGIAVQKYNAYEATTRSYKEVQALYTVTAIVTQSLNLDAVVEEAANKITDIFHFDGTSVYLFNSDRQTFEIRGGLKTKPDNIASCWFRRERGIMDKVVETDEPFICEDIRNDSQYLELSESQLFCNNTNRFLAIFPIKTNRTSWGVMVCVGQSPRTLQPESINLLRSMSSQIGIAVENATLYQETSNKAKELSALYSIAVAASTSLDVDMILQKTMQKVLEIFGFHGARVYLRQDALNEVTLVSHQGMPADISLIEKYRIGAGGIGKVMETGDPLYVEDMRTDPVYNKIAQHKNMVQAGFRSSFISPIKIGGECIGVVNFLSKKPHRFSEADFQLMHSIAYPLGAAVANANLFSRVEQRTRELEKANKAKDEFLGVMSHELRTPLNVIIGYTTLIKEGSFGEIKSEQNKALEKVATQSKYLSDMVDEIIRVTRIEMGKADLDRREFDVAEFFDDLRSTYDLPVGKDIRFNWDYPHRVTNIRSDSDKLRHMLQNLMSLSGMVEIPRLQAK